MSLHLLSHPWQVQDLAHGLVVTITPRDLEADTLAVLPGELFELARESGQTDLTLDFAGVKVLPAVVAGKLLALDRKLRQASGCLLMSHLEPAVKESLIAAGWPVGPAPESLLPERQV
jgi:anti-anti-sigma regulatory factor